MATTHYTVKTCDVDGSGTRRFVTLAGAVRRFEEMVGHTVAAAIAERFEAPTTIEALTHLEAVSMFGTLVTFQAYSLEAKAAAAAARAAAAAAKTADVAKDWVVVAASPTYGSRDEVTGTSRAPCAGPFATEDEAGAALGALYDADGNLPCDETDYFVARVSTGLRREASKAPATDWAGEADIPF